MRKSVVIICIAVLVFCLWLLLHRKAENNSETQLQQTNSQPANLAVNSPQVTTSPTVPKPSAASIAEAKAKFISTPAGSNALQQRMLADWQKPIEFYGKVIDEKSNPVAGAGITFRWTETPTEEGNRITNVESDTDGLFSLTDARGPGLTVTVGKNGYYTSRSTSDSFRYGSGQFQADWANPVVFHLIKKGQGVDLITSQHGMQLKVDVDLSRDNVPAKVDFFQKQTSPTGQLEIKQIKPPFQTATNWSFSLSIPSGGLVENHDEFQFQALESGYQPTVEYNFTKGTTNWTTQVTKQFYITIDGKYGWLRIESNLTQETVFLTYAINPTGSRNLEPK